jgi:hypothetical protein
LEDKEGFALMFIKSIDGIDKETKEAEVIVSDGFIDILCFSHPLKDNNVNDILTEPIHCFDVEDVVIAKGQISYANKCNTYFGYSICGKFINKENNLVLVGNIKVCLNKAYVPNDRPEGSFIEFDVSRLDLY